jgi:putative intracellular protease/amidase
MTGAARDAWRRVGGGPPPRVAEASKDRASPCKRRAGRESRPAISKPLTDLFAPPSNRPRFRQDNGAGGSRWMNRNRRMTVMKVLMVITSHDQLGDTGRKTGFWLEELAAPYFVFKDARADITLASPKGGRPPLDPKSNEPAFRTDLTLRFEKDAAAEAQLDRTVRLDSVRQEDFDTVFYPGGHGPMWDLAEDSHSIKLIESFIAAGKTIGIVCHSTGALRHVKGPDGKLLVQGKEVTGFTNGEEEEVGLTKIVPFLVEDEMLRLGATFSKTANWTPHVVRDGLLVTGQNPHSSGPAAQTLLAIVGKSTASVAAS